MPGEVERNAQPSGGIGAHKETLNDDKPTVESAVANITKSFFVNKNGGDACNAYLQCILEITSYSKKNTDQKSVAGFLKEVQNKLPEPFKNVLAVEELKFKQECQAIPDGQGLQCHLFEAYIPKDISTEDPVRALEHEKLALTNSLTADVHPPRNQDPRQTQLTTEHPVPQTPRKAAQQNPQTTEQQNSKTTDNSKTTQDNDETF